MQTEFRKCSSESESQRVDVNSVAIEAVLDTLQLGIILFNEHSEVLLTNSSARSMINGKDWLWLADSRLKFKAAENDDLQQRILASVHQRISGTDSLMVLNGRHKEDFLLMAFTAVNTIDNRQVVVCILVDPGTGQSTDISLLQDLYSLTDAEIDITSMIASGIDYGDIAKRRKVTVGTIRSFTKSIFKKLGVSSRAEVVHKTQTAMIPLSMLNRQ